MVELSIFSHKNKEQRETNKDVSPFVSSNNTDQTPLQISTSLKDNNNNLHDIFKNCIDVVYRELTINSIKQDVLIVYIESIADSKVVNENIISPIMDREKVSNISIESENIITYIKKEIIRIGSIKEIYNFNDLSNSLLSGNSILIIDGCCTCISISTTEDNGRAVEDPSNEAVLRGPKEGFTETLQTNLALIRHRIKSPNLKIEKYILGKVTQTDVAIVYVENIVNDKVLIELRRRLEAIDIDGVLESSYIEEFIEDDYNTVFPLIRHTERPDKASADILEGKVVIIVDNTPVVLIVPSLGIQFLQSSDDYYERHQYTDFVRMIRLLFFFIGLLLPGLYISATTFHQELIPTTLLIRIGVSREGIPFPTWVEVLILDISFEGLREAGLRLPKSVGQSVSIVGALVIGDAAVKAGIVSPLTVIIVALTGIASFSIPAYNIGLGVRLLRFVITFAATILGLFGVTVVMIILLVHVLSLYSFGIPYMSPIAPFKLKDMKDTFIRVSWKSMKRRPESIGNKNKSR